MSISFNRPSKASCRTTISSASAEKVASPAIAPNINIKINLKSHPFKSAPKKKNSMNPKEQHDFLNAIDALGQKELLILINGFSRQVIGTRYSCGMDLLHETMNRVLAGERQWRKDIALGAFLHEAMRSVLSVDTRGSKFRPLSYEDWMSPTVDGPEDFGAPPETLLLRVEEMAQARKAIEDAKSRLSDDAEAHQLLRSESLNLTPAEAREFFGMSEKTYKAARERIARDIRAHTKRPWR